MITSSQFRYLKAIDDFFIANDQFPPLSSLSLMVHRSHNAAQEALVRLEYSGVIERNACGKYKRGEHYYKCLKQGGVK